MSIFPDNTTKVYLIYDGDYDISDKLEDKHSAVVFRHNNSTHILLNTPGLKLRDSSLHKRYPGYSKAIPMNDYEGFIRAVTSSGKSDDLIYLNNSDKWYVKSSKDHSILNETLNFSTDQPLEYLHVSITSVEEYCRFVVGVFTHLSYASYYTEMDECGKSFVISSKLLSKLSPDHDSLDVYDKYLYNPVLAIIPRSWKTNNWCITDFKETKEIDRLYNSLFDAFTFRCIKHTFDPSDEDGFDNVIHKNILSLKRSKKESSIEEAYNCLTASIESSSASKAADYIDKSLVVRLFSQMLARIYKLKYTNLKQEITNDCEDTQLRILDKKLSSAIKSPNRSNNSRKTLASIENYRRNKK